MRTQLTRLRGFQDILGPDAQIIAELGRCLRELARCYSAREIILPVVERIQLYERSSGETSDIVEKQMYAFAESEAAELGDDDAEGGDTRTSDAATKVALRPEGTPGVVRAFIEAGLDKSDPEQRFFYLGPMFRRERPQKGRYRQFLQFGVEFFGRDDPLCDAELLTMVADLGRMLDLTFDLQINSLGCAECRPAFRAALLEFGRSHWAELCDDCHSRLERNPLRVLDCKTDVALAEQAPASVDFLCAACRAHFDSVRAMLDAADVPHRLNPRIVRGLDYYVRTTFEAGAAGLGAQNTVAAGGRYDGLVAALGGAAVPATGFAVGMERLALAWKARQDAVNAPTLIKSEPRIALLSLGEKAARVGARLVRGVRAAGLPVETVSPERGLKAQLRRADRMGARYVVIIGERELEQGIAFLRDLKVGTQRAIALDRVEADLLRLRDPA